MTGERNKARRAERSPLRLPADGGAPGRRRPAGLLGAARGDQRDSLDAPGGERVSRVVLNTELGIDAGTIAAWGRAGLEVDEHAAQAPDTLDGAGASVLVSACGCHATSPAGQTCAGCS